MLKNRQIGKKLFAKFGATLRSDRCSDRASSEPTLVRIEYGTSTNGQSGAADGCAVRRTCASEGGV